MKQKILISLSFAGVILLSHCISSKVKESNETLAQVVAKNITEHPNDWSERDGTVADTISNGFTLPSVIHISLIENKRCNIKIVHTTSYLGNLDTFEMVSPDTVLFFDKDKAEIIDAFNHVQTMKADSIAAVEKEKRLIKEEEIKKKLCQ